MLCVALVYFVYCIIGHLLQGNSCFINTSHVHLRRNRSQINIIFTMCLDSKHLKDVILESFIDRKILIGNRSMIIMSPLRMKGDIMFQSDFFFFRFFCFFSAKLFRTITCLSFQIGRWCMTIRWCVVYHNDLRGTLTFDLKVK